VTEVLLFPLYPQRNGFNYYYSLELAEEHRKVFPEMKLQLFQLTTNLII
jgi:hypothetical protein